MLAALSLANHSQTSNTRRFFPEVYSRDIIWLRFVWAVDLVVFHVIE
jgi:hypothetical protein